MCYIPMVLTRINFGLAWHHHDDSGCVVMCNWPVARRNAMHTARVCFTVSDPVRASRRDSG